MPAEDRIGRNNGGNLQQYFAAQDFAFDGQATTLVIAEKNSLPAQLLFEDLILGDQVFDDLLLLPVEPAGQNNQQQLPGMQNQAHGSPDADDGEKTLASGLCQLLSSGRDELKLAGDRAS
jgi:hypothetical protein